MAIRRSPGVLAEGGGIRQLDGAGHGPAPTILFLHGWGVGPHSYDEPLSELSAFGCGVLSPAQPGFGGTKSLPADQCNFAGYARWAAQYLDSTGVDEPVTVIGHSFGGGVAVQLAHDFPEKVRAVVLCNAVGGVRFGSSNGAMDKSPDGAINDRPWWEWGRYLGADLFALPHVARVLPALLGEAVPNFARNPIAVWRVAEFVRRADLRVELASVAKNGTPVTVVWSDRDQLVPHAGFSGYCSAAGCEGVVVPGHHSWLIAEPRRFADIVLCALVEAGVLDDVLESASAFVRTALVPTKAAAGGFS